MQIAAYNQYLQPFEALIVQEGLSSDSEVKSCCSKLEGWLLSLASNPILNGYSLKSADSKSSPMPYEKTLGLLMCALEEDKLNTLIAWLVSYYDENAAKKLVNPLVWHQAAMKFVILQQQRPETDVDPDESKVEKMIKTGQFQLDFLDKIKKDEKFWEKLCDEYFTALKAVDMAFQDYANEVSISKLGALNDKYVRKTPGNSNQKGITKLNLLDPEEKLILEFSQRTVHSISEIIPSKITGSELDALPKLENRDRIYASLCGKLSPELLCTEFLGLQKLHISQDGVLQGLSINYEKYPSDYVQRRNQGADVPHDNEMIRFNAQHGGIWGFHCNHCGGDDKANEVSPLWDNDYNPSRHLKDAVWSLTLLLKDEKEENLASLEYSGLWAEGGVSNEEAPKIEIHKNKGSVVKNSEGYYCFHPLTPNGSIGLKNAFQKFAIHWWNKWNLNDTKIKFSAKIISENTHNDNLKKDIQSYFRDERVRIALELLGDKNSTPALKRFKEALTLLDIASNRIKAFAHLVGQSISDPVFSLLINSKKIREDLDKYIKDNTLLFTIPSLVEALKDKHPVKALKAKNMVLAPTHPRGLLIESVRRLKLYLMHKNIMRSRCPILFTRINIRDEIEKANRQLLDFFYRDMKEFCKELINESAGVLKAIDQIKHKEISKKESYDAAREALWRLALTISVRATATGIVGLKEFQNSDKSLKSIKEMVSSNNLEITPKSKTYLDTKLTYDWQDNFLLLALLAASSKAHVSKELLLSDKICNPELWHDGALWFVQLLNSKAYDEYSKKDEEGLCHDTSRITQMIQHGVMVLQLINSIALSDNFFEYLFNCYLESLQKLDQKDTGFIRKRIEQEGASDMLVWTAMENKEDTLSGQVEMCFKEMDTYRLLINSYMSMTLAYEEDLTKKLGPLSLEVLIKDFKPYLKDVKKEYEERPLLKRIEEYRKLVESLKKNLLDFIQNRKSIFLFSAMLESYFKDNWPCNTLVITSDNCFGYEITKGHIALIESFFKSHPYVSKVIFSGLAFHNESSYLALISCLNKNPQVVHVGLLSMGIVPEQLEPLSTLLDHLEVLDISKNKIGNQEDASNLVEFIEKSIFSETLKNLNLSENQLSSLDFVNISIRVLFSKAMRDSKLYINVIGNSIGDEPKNECAGYFNKDDLVQFEHEKASKISITEKSLPAKPYAAHFISFVGHPRIDPVLIMLKQTLDMLICKRDSPSIDKNSRNNRASEALLKENIKNQQSPLKLRNIINRNEGGVITILKAADKEINLTNRRLITFEWHCLFYVLQHRPIENLNLSGTRLPIQGLQKLSESSKSLSNLTILDISNNVFSGFDGEFEKLLKLILKQTLNIQKINFSGMSIELQTFRNLIPILSDLPKLESLELLGDSLSPLNFFTIIHEFPDFKQLTIGKTFTFTDASIVPFIEETSNAFYESKDWKFYKEELEGYRNNIMRLRKEKAYENEKLKAVEENRLTFEMAEKYEFFKADLPIDVSFFCFYSRNLMVNPYNTSNGKICEFEAITGGKIHVGRKEIIATTKNEEVFQKIQKFKIKFSIQQRKKIERLSFDLEKLDIPLKISKKIISIGIEILKHWRQSCLQGSISNLGNNLEYNNSHFFGTGIFFTEEAILDRGIIDLKHYGLPQYTLDVRKLLGRFYREGFLGEDEYARLHGAPWEVNSTYKKESLEFLGKLWDKLLNELNPVFCDKLIPGPDRLYSENSTGMMSRHHLTQIFWGKGKGIWAGPSHLDFKTSYKPEICHFFQQMSGNKPQCIRITFLDLDCENNTHCFKDQLKTLIVLSNDMQRNAIFISKQPGIDQQFICGLVRGKELLLINPLGITNDNNGCYQVLADMQKEGALDKIFLSSEVLEKFAHENGISYSSGPITVELAGFILSNITVEQLDEFWNNELNNVLECQFDLCLMSNLPSDCKPKRREMYLEKNGTQLRYIVLNPRGESVTDFLDMDVKEPLTKELLNGYKTYILDFTSKKGHTPKRNVSERHAATGLAYVKAQINTLLPDVLFRLLESDSLEDYQKKIIGLRGGHMLKLIAFSGSLKECKEAPVQVVFNALLSKSKTIDNVQTLKEYTLLEEECWPGMLEALLQGLEDYIKWQKFQNFFLLNNFEFSLLGNVLIKNSSLVSLKISNKIPQFESYLEKLSKILPSFEVTVRNYILKQLDHSSEELARIKATAKILEENKNIKYFCITGFHCEKLAEIISDSVKSNAALDTLSLSFNGIPSLNANYIADTIKRDFLVTLDLSWNSLRNEGVKIICDSVRLHGSLQKLSLRSNGIGDEAGDPIGNMIKRNKTLVDLDLAGNDFEDEGLKKIIEGLKQNSSLQALRLDKAFSNLDKILSIIKTLEGSHTVEFSKDLHRNSFTPSFKNNKKLGIEAGDYLRSIKLKPAE